MCVSYIKVTDNLSQYDISQSKLNIKIIVMNKPVNVLKLITKKKKEKKE